MTDRVTERPGQSGAFPGPDRLVASRLAAPLLFALGAALALVAANAPAPVQHADVAVIDQMRGDEATRLAETGR